MLGGTGNHSVSLGGSCRQTKCGLLWTESAAGGPIQHKPTIGTPKTREHATTTRVNVLIGRVKQRKK